MLALAHRFDRRGLVVHRGEPSVALLAAREGGDRLAGLPSPIHSESGSDAEESKMTPITERGGSGGMAAKRGEGRPRAPRRPVGARSYERIRPARPPPVGLAPSGLSAKAEGRRTKA